MALSNLIAKIKSSPRAKSLVHALLIPPHDYKPRLWVRLFVNPFIHSVKGKVRWRARLDTVPFHQFSLGKRAIVEDQCLINNVMGSVHIGDGTLLGVGSTIIGPATIGADVMLAQHVVISALNHEFQSIVLPIRAQGVSVSRIHVGDGSWIGVHAIVLPGVTIGKNCVVAAGAVVTKDVPDFCVVVGNPAKIVRRFSAKTQLFERWKELELASVQL